jgi:hypothetical protein
MTGPVFFVRALWLQAFARMHCALRGHEDVHCADVGKRRRWVHCLRCGRNSAGVIVGVPHVRP